MTIREHSRLLAGFFFIGGVLRAFGWIVTGGMFGGELLLLLSAAFFMFTGWKIENGKPNAKIFGIIASVLCLPGFPIGTALGVYGLWFFLMKSKDDY